MHVKRLILFLIVSLFLISVIGYIYINFFYSSTILPKSINLNNINLYQKNEVFIQNWTLSIPKLHLINIPIKDNIDQDTLNDFIGHFPTSSYLKGNVCLAAHNAGFSFNFFQDLPLLEIGDEIEYNYYHVSKKYIVSRKYEIDEDDFNVLNVDNLDKLTLITCISGSPSKRLCVEAICEE